MWIQNLIFILSESELLVYFHNCNC